MNEEPLLITIDRGVAWLTLNRPEVGNSIDLPMAQALLKASIRCQTDAEIRCVVLTGAGRLFCAGGDVGLMEAAGDLVSSPLGDCYVIAGD